MAYYAIQNHKDPARLELLMETAILSYLAAQSAKRKIFPQDFFFSDGFPISEEYKIIKRNGLNLEHVSQVLYDSISKRRIVHDPNYGLLPASLVN